MRLLVRGGAVKLENIMKHPFSFSFRMVAAGVLALGVAGCRSMLEGTAFAPQPDNTAARMAYSLQQAERDLARLKARVEAFEKQSERLEARIIAAEGQAREVARLRAELGEYRADVKDLRVELPQSMGATIKKMLDDNQAQTLSQVQRALSSSRQAAARQAESGYNHTVAAGQTLSLIAREYKTTVNAILKANNLKNANQIRVGQVLFIPAD